MINNIPASMPADNHQYAKFIFVDNLLIRLLLLVDFNSDCSLPFFLFKKLIN